MSKLVVLAVLAAAIAYWWYDKHVPVHKSSTALSKTLSNLVAAVGGHKPTFEHKVAVCCGACLDGIMEGVPLMNEMGFDAPTEQGRHHDVVTDRTALLESFAYFFEAGAAAERYVNDDLFAEMLTASKSLSDREGNVKWALGGNAPVIGRRIAMFGSSVLLGSSVNEDLEHHLHPNEQPTERTKSEDVHLILEYRRRDEWGSLKAHRANRYALHSDDNNANLRSMEEFFAQVGDFEPDLVIISGLQLMDGFPFASKEERNERITKLKQLTEEVDTSIPVHLELASFADAELLNTIEDALLGTVNSIGVNEQELPMLYHAIMESDDLPDSHPALPNLDECMEYVKEIFSVQAKSTKKPHREIDRLHVHTLGFQLVCQKKDTKFWDHPRKSVANASLVATRHVCGMEDEIDVSGVKLLPETYSTYGSHNFGSEDGSADVHCWDEGNLDCCQAPVLVCRHPQHTVGGGDNITGAGLVANLK